MYPQINDQSSIIESIILYFPSDLVVKFMHRNSIIDVDTNINIVFSEYQKKYISKIYNSVESEYVQLKEHTNYIVMFTETVDETIYTLIDRHNNLVHLNSNKRASIEATVHNLCKQGFIPISILSERRSKTIKTAFTMKYYNLYYLGGGMQYKNSNN